MLLNDLKEMHEIEHQDGKKTCTKRTTCLRMGGERKTLSVDEYDRKWRETLCRLPEKGYRATPSYSS